MAILAAKIILGGSLIGIGAILFRKIPVLVEIPESEIGKFDWKTLLLKPLGLIKSFKDFSSNLILQKILSKVKIMSLKVEKKADGKLQELREEVKRKKDRTNDNYWEELKKAKDHDEDLPA